jgi:hypothetical protein
LSATSTSSASATRCQIPWLPSPRTVRSRRSGGLGYLPLSEYFHFLTFQRFLHLSPFFSHSCALFCTQRKLNPFQWFPHSASKNTKCGGIVLTVLPPSPDALQLFAASDAATLGDQRRSRKEESGAVLDQLESHVHDQLPIVCGEAAEKLVQPIEEFRRFTRAAHSTSPADMPFGRDGTSGGCSPS